MKYQNRSFIHILFSFCIISGIAIFHLSAQEPQEYQKLRIMFYNVENYFDSFDDTLKNDNEFLPDSEKHWTYKRYNEKTRKIFQVIAAIGELQAPHLIAFAEIENRYVLSHLVNNTPLAKVGYKIVHFDSPDQRGIDVGLIYNPKSMIPLTSDAIEVDLPGKNQATRDILYFKALLQNSDTLHFFINHWPSRRGGQLKSEPKRIIAADVLRLKIDSLMIINPCANIIITGDFNDEPADKSLYQTLKALPPVNTAPECINLYNLSLELKNNCSCGTYRYKAYWNMIDQFIVSGNLLSKQSKIHTSASNLKIGDLDFLLEEDTRYGGFKPKRTYSGPRYLGGFSDHLPVYLDITLH